MDKEIFGKPRCMAMNSSGTQCGHPALNGENLCSSHLKMSKAEIEIVEPRKNRYGNWLPTNLIGVYEEILEEEDLINLEEEVATSRARLAEMYEMRKKNYPIRWQEFKSMWAEFMLAVEEGDRRKQTELLSELNKFVTGERDHLNDWVEIRRQEEHVRKMVQSGHLIQEKRGQLMPIEKVIALLGEFFAVWKTAAYLHAPTVADKIVERANDKTREIIAT